MANADPTSTALDRRGNLPAIRGKSQALLSTVAKHVAAAMLRLGCPGLCGGNKMVQADAGAACHRIAFSVLAYMHFLKVNKQTN